MTYNLVVARPAPEPPYTDELIAIDVQAVPYMLSALFLRAQKYNWLPGNDAKLGRQLMMKQSAELLMGRTQELINAVDRVYISFEAHMAGITRTATPSATLPGAFDYVPALAQSADAQDAVSPSLRCDTEATRNYVDNLTTGVANSYVADNRNIRDQLQALIDKAVATGEFDAEMLAELVKVVALLGV